jgi:hypothetical protein
MHVARLVLAFLTGTARRLEQLLAQWHDAIGPRPEAGMTTAELLGNAALGIAALVAIWGVLQVLGLDVMTWIRGQLRV